MGDSRAAPFALTHRTRYAFDRSVTIAPHEVRLRPAPHARMRVDAYSFTVQPAEHTLHWQQDAYGNWVARLTYPAPANVLALQVELAGALVAFNPFNFFVEPDAASFPFVYADATRHALGPFFTLSSGTDSSHAVPAQRRTDRRGAEGAHFAAWIAGFRAALAADEPTIALLVRLNQQLHATVTYQIRDEQGVQTPEATLAAASGSCRDSAWLLTILLRELGIAARFVSGYLVELANAAGTRDAGSLHAWTEAFVPGAGWIGLDPTSGLLAGSGHIPLACAAEPQGAAAVIGTTSACGVTFTADIEVHGGANAHDELMARHGRTAAAALR